MLVHLVKLLWSREISGFRLCEVNCNKIAIMCKQILIWLFSGVAFVSILMVQVTQTDEELWFDGTELKANFMF